MTRIVVAGTDNPDGLIALLNSLPSGPDLDEAYELVFPSDYLYSCVFPVIAAWSKRLPASVRLSLDLHQCQESARRLVENVGLVDIVEEDLESPRRVLKGAANVPLQPIVVGRSTDEVLDRVHRMVEEWAGYNKDTSAFRTMLSEMTENVLVHSESATPGYVHARVHRSQQGEKCEITFADSGIGILNSYLEGTNESVKARLRNGGSALQIALDGLNSSKPNEFSPGGRSYFGYGLFTVKRLIELNRGRMTLISGSDVVTLDRFTQNLGQLARPWQGTIVALVVDLMNPLLLDRVYEEQEARMVPPRHKKATSVGQPAEQPAPSPITKEVPELLPSTPAPATHTLVVRNISTTLLSRETGLILRAELATLLADGAAVDVELDGIEDITPSVADECFGKLAIRLGGARYHARVALRGGSPLLHRLIDFVVANRLKTVEPEESAS